jgi:WhiB family redox-sensing transcriptional regulator
MYEWMDDALCRQVDMEMFFPKPHEVPHDAIKTCKLCNVRTECLEYALQHPVEGVWGGTTTEQRKTLRAGMRKTA